MEATAARSRIDPAKLLSRLGACREAIAWVGDMPSKRAWETCERGDWLLWLSARVGVDRKLVVLAACDCAELALKHVPAGENRPREAIETARAWTRGEANIEQVRDAAAAADAAAAYAAAAADAAGAAAYAAEAAADAADAAGAARTKVRRQCADLVRARIPWTKVAAAIKGKE
jgi:hypothetical protein